MSVLDEILADVRRDLVDRQQQLPLEHLKDLAGRQEPALDPLPAYRSNGISVITEVKRASPSRGRLADIADPGALAAEYEAGGAATISVLTEERRFGGSLEDMRSVRAAVSVPILRKDFVVSAYQLWEARAAGADLVLLITAALTHNELTGLFERACSIGLTPLVEAHTPDEVRRAVDVGADLIGINARDLTTLTVDRGTFAALAPLVPDDVVRVAESGVRGPHDVLDYARQGADVVLVGESLVTGGNPRQMVADMVAAGAHPALRQRRFT